MSRAIGLSLAQNSESQISSTSFTDSLMALALMAIQGKPPPEFRLLPHNLSPTIMAEHRQHIDVEE
jgi:hypothetical protein